MEKYESDEESIIFSGKLLVIQSTKCKDEDVCCIQLANNNKIYVCYKSDFTVRDVHPY